MTTAQTDALTDLTNELARGLGDDLQAVVLFGSAAEDRRRAVSDTNIVVVLRRFTPQLAAAVRKQLVLVKVALRLRLMVLCADELPGAAAAFAVKFADILRRRRVLYGKDPFTDLVIPRPAAIAQLRQAVMNLVLRLREQLLSSSNDDQLTVTAAEAAGGLRACAAELLALEGTPAPSPREALQKVAGGDLDELSAAREGRLPSGAGIGLAERLLVIADVMRTRAERLT